MYFVLLAEWVQWKQIGLASSKVFIAFYVYYKEMSRLLSICPEWLCRKWALSGRCVRIWIDYSSDVVVASAIAIP